MTLFPTVAVVIVPLQEPPYLIVPASSEVNVYSGVVSLVTAGTGVTSPAVGVVVSNSKLYVVSIPVSLIAIVKLSTNPEKPAAPQLLPALKPTAEEIAAFG